MNKFVLVHFVGSGPELGYTFQANEWPLHLTIVPTFSIDMNPEALSALVNEKISETEPIPFEGGDDALFGSGNNLPVTRIKDNEKLTELHNKILALLEDKNAVFRAPDFIGKGYKPHVTVQGQMRFNIGEKAIVNELAMVDARADGNKSKRRVLIKMPLAHSI